MDQRVETAWRFGAIVGGVIALLILVIVLVIGITLLRRYLHNKQRKHRHYSHHVEDGIVTSKGTFSRVTFGVLWSSRQPNGNQSSSHINNEATDIKPHAFAMATEPNNQSSCELHLRTEATIRVTPTATPTIDDAVQVTSKDVTERDEAVYYELEDPTEVTAAGDTEGVHNLMRCDVMATASKELTTTRCKSSNSYSSISSDIQKLPPPPIVFPPHRRGRRYSLPNNLLPVVTTVQFSTTDNPNYVNYRYGRRNSDPSVSVIPPPALPTTGATAVSSPAEYEKPMSSYMSLDLSSVIHHSYTPLHLSSDPNTPTEPVGFPRQQLSMTTRLPINYLRMNSIPEENNYEKLNPLPKPSLIRSHDQQ